MKITKIKKLDSPMITADIEVENTHTYQMSNGAVSHNTVSELVNTSSGIHPRYSKYYIRTIRGDKKDPLTTLISDSGVPTEDDIQNPSNTSVFSFPIQSPRTSIFREDLTAIDQLELWKIYALYWCEHKPSITIFVHDEEWLKVGAWVYDNFDILSGVSFFPYSNHMYKQAPFQELNNSEFKKAKKQMPDIINWDKVIEYEKEDNTTATQELACSSGVCDII